jgi:hypothetical protein
VAAPPSAASTAKASKAGPGHGTSTHASIRARLAVQHRAGRQPLGLAVPVQEADNAPRPDTLTWADQTGS